MEITGSFPLRADGAALTAITALCSARGSSGRSPELPVAIDGPSSEGLLGEHARSQLQCSPKPQ